MQSPRRETGERRREARGSQRSPGSSGQASPGLRTEARPSRPAGCQPRPARATRSRPDGQWPPRHRPANRAEGTEIAAAPSRKARVEQDEDVTGRPYIYTPEYCRPRQSHVINYGDTIYAITFQTARSLGLAIYRPLRCSSLLPLPPHFYAAAACCALTGRSYS